MISTIYTTNLRQAVRDYWKGTGQNADRIMMVNKETGHYYFVDNFTEALTLTENFVNGTRFVPYINEKADGLTDI